MEYVVQVGLGRNIAQFLDSVSGVEGFCLVSSKRVILEGREDMVIMQLCRLGAQKLCLSSKIAQCSVEATLEG